MQKRNALEINPEYIKALPLNPEGVDVEFKETTGQLNRGMETLCGMVNGKVGIVIFGVNNKGKIVGQEVGDKTTREIGEALRKFDPALIIEPIYIPIDESGKHLIVFKDPSNPTSTNQRYGLTFKGKAIYYSI